MGSKPFTQLMIEAIVVGQLLNTVHYITRNMLFPYIHNTMIIIFLSGFIYHILCEITGINLMYVKNYNKYLAIIEHQLK